MNPEPLKKRLFVGTYLTPQQQELLGKVSEQKSELERQLASKVRLVKEHKLHLTWLFLGDVLSGKVPEIQDKLKIIAESTKELSLTYSQVELWPSNIRPRMIVLTPCRVSDDVHNLASKMTEELGSYVNKPGHRQYRPHITLARLRRDDIRGSTKIPDWLIAGCSLPIVHQIRRVELIQSELGQHLDEYSTLFSSELS